MGTLPCKDAQLGSVMLLDRAEHTERLIRDLGSPQFGRLIKDLLLTGCGKFIEWVQSLNPTWSLNQTQKWACGGVHRNDVHVHAEVHTEVQACAHM